MHFHPLFLDCLVPFIIPPPGVLTCSEAPAQLCMHAWCVEPTEHRDNKWPVILIPFLPSSWPLLNKDTAAVAAAAAAAAAAQYNYGNWSGSYLPIGSALN